ncbi:MAG: T9SS C-terminal target domain-containing protein [Candidatus Zixiibacteriota bacterium]|nr:MAG: T9SS C-terminal target domain-containing protein [candidate division Zixibacteria bacterium]
MRRTALCFFLLLCAGAAFAGSPLGDWSAVISPGLDASGGPDLYGYTWKDQAEPGGPTYNWKDITTIGTQVTGLGDDNYVGAFTIGFPFHFYWYDVSTYYIGSNGYLKLPPAANISSAFPASIPLPAAPNDYLAVYTADWDMSSGGTCYRWNNADSLVVSWINVPAWFPTPPGPSGSHTFQVILSRLDSSVTFQFGPQTGTMYQTDVIRGIESVTGLMGLQHSVDVLAVANTAVKFYYPPVVTAIINDLASVASGNANSEGFFVLAGTAVSPWGKVKNVGNQTAASFTVNCTIQQTGGAIVYNQTQTLGPLAPGQELEVPFTQTWTPSVSAEYTYKITVNLTGDVNPNNNIKTTEVHSMLIPGTLLYDDGSNNQAWSWAGGNGGLGMRFVPPEYPVVIDSIRFFIPTATSTAHPFTAQILDDDGPNGYPGTVLFTQSITNVAGSNQWRGAATSITITEGAFYVAWQMQDSLTSALGTDNTNNLGSRQSYEYTGVWAPFRNSETHDAMIRVKISYPGVTPNVTISMTPINPPIVIPAGGGSFNFNATLLNSETTTQTIDAWIMLRLPNQTWYGPVLGPLTLTLPPSANITRLRIQNIPASAPQGAYWYEGRVGDYPNTVWDTSGFAFAKSATDGQSLVHDWANWGESFELADPAQTPADHALVNVYPNPFNPSATIRYSLAQAGLVDLAVYDLAGREVTRLVDGYREAGSHAVTFDGSGLASGVYLYRLNAGGHLVTAKMVLLK